ncbi:MAG: chemotaxis protein CheD [Bacteroidetes bacterium]|nr:chemotaxis protein CheD [Bacteroidota bacterium]MBU1115619.1 chemotaxis protein CheD [Bacteroidota bacterium]MBU1797609.1 chemotaxis protein CheD [Bacteroidota bacterium]
MKPDLDGLKNVYLHPGEACFSSKPIAVSTVLGSCLSITFYSRKIKYAGISHCQLPNSRECKSDCDNCLDPFKFVNCTISAMIKKFEKMQIQRKDIEVKIFGGADIIKSSSKERRTSTVGRQNIQMAEEILRKNNMNITASDVGGALGRKIFFLTETGEIFLNRIKSNG